MSKISGELIDAIKAALEAKFGDTYEIHTMETEQDLKKPCFFVSYDCFVYCRDETAVMENLETKIDTGGDGIDGQEKREA